MAVSEAGDVVAKSGGLISSVFNFLSNPWVLGIGGVAALVAFGDPSFTMSADAVSASGADIASASATGDPVEVSVGGAEMLSFATNAIGQGLEALASGLEGLNDLVNG